MNKEIIIDGVDVSDCNVHYLQYGTDIAMCGHEVQQDDNSYIAVQCCLRPNCYYKQLARLTAQYNAVVEQNKALQAELKGKEQECEELKKASLTLAEGLNIRQDKLDHYRKALDEIEEIIDNDDWGYCPLDDREDCHGNTYLKILDIINKAKGASDNAR